MMFGTAAPRRTPARRVTRRVMYALGWGVMINLVVAFVCSILTTDSVRTHRDLFARSNTDLQLATILEGVFDFRAELQQVSGAHEARLKDAGYLSSAHLDFAAVFKCGWGIRREAIFELVESIPYPASAGPYGVGPPEAVFTFAGWPMLSMYGEMWFEAPAILEGIPLHSSSGRSGDFGGLPPLPDQYNVSYVWAVPAGSGLEGSEILFGVPGDLPLPLRPMPVGFVVNVMVYAAMMLAIQFLYSGVRKRWRWRRGRCRECGHVVSELETCCQECGSSFPTKQ